MSRYHNAPASSLLPGGVELRGFQASMAGVVPTLLPIADPAVEPESGGSVCNVGSDPLGEEGLWDEWPSLESVPDDLRIAAACFPYGTSAAARPARAGEPLLAFTSAGEVDAGPGPSSPSVAVAAPPLAGGVCFSPCLGSGFGDE